MQQDSSSVSPIRAINDLARRNKIPAEYRLEKETGPDHAKLFTVRLRLGNRDYLGTDRSIKMAQRAAAQIALEEMKNQNNDRTSPTIDQDSPPTSNTQSPTVALNAWANRHHISTQYVLLDERIAVPASNLSWHHPRMLFFYGLHLGPDLYFEGHGSSHHQARTHCALNAFAFLRQNQMSLMSPPSTPQLQQCKSDISLMYDRARQLGLSVRVECDDPSSATYYIGDQYSARGTGPNKHAAKQAAAERLLQLLPASSPASNESQKTTRKRPTSTTQHRKFIEQKGASDYGHDQQINPIARLYQLARARQTNVEFSALNKLDNEKDFGFHVRFGDETAEGRGTSKRTAKRAAAEALLSKLDPEIVASIVVLAPPSPPPLPPPPAKGLLKRDGSAGKSHEKKHVHFVEEELPEEKANSENVPPPPFSEQSPSNKQQLVESCRRLNINVEYQDELDANNDHGSARNQSIVSLSTGDRLLAQFRGSGPTLLRAQENASSAAWNNLRQLFNGSIQPPTSVKNVKRKKEKRGGNANKNRPAQAVKQ